MVEMSTFIDKEKSEIFNIRSTKIVCIIIHVCLNPTHIEEQFNWKNNIILYKTYRKIYNIIKNRISDEADYDSISEVERILIKNVK